MGEFLYLPYDKVASNLIWEGDFLLTRGRGFIAKGIGVAGGGIHTHASLASYSGKNGDSLLECIEFREWYGGRSVSLRSQVALNSGRIDVFRPVSPFKTLQVSYENNELILNPVWKYYNGRLTTNTLRKLTGLPYGWRRIFWLAKFHLPFIRLFTNPSIDDNGNEIIYPVCSTAIAHVAKKTFVDLVKFRSDERTEPSDLARSPILNYLFTLEADF